jgi:agmatinase
MVANCSSNINYNIVGKCVRYFQLKEVSMSNKPDLAALFGATDSKTFLGLEACVDFENIDASSAFIGAPCATPYGSVGAYAQNGPASLRKAINSLTANIDRHNFDLGGPTFPKGAKRAVDCGDLPWNDNNFAKNRQTIRQAVSKVVSRGVIPIVIGGDDSIPIPMLDAMADTGKSYTILQIDAHIDWREAHMGETHGLSSTMRRASEMGHIEKIIQVGARGIGSGHSSDYEDAIAWGAKFFTGSDIHRNGLQPAIEQIGSGDNIILCIDIDAMDPSITPNTIGRAPGGLSYYQVFELICAAADRGRIAAVDFVEIMPEVDIDGIGGLTVSRLVAATMGIIARQELAESGHK